MPDFKNLIALIQNTVDSFNETIPGLQKKMLEQLQAEIKALDVKDGKIKIATSNLKLVAAIKSKLQQLILSPEYIGQVKKYTAAFNDVTKLQNEYFESVADKFSPPKLTKEIKKQAMASVISKLTESGLDANIIQPASDIIRKAITGGGLYGGLNKQLTDFLTENESGPGQLQRYSTQITTDALNQFSGQYSQIVSSDLGFEWFRYSGSNIETSRPFCLACTDRKFFHISELPLVIKGQFEEFKKYDGVINVKTGLPNGMIAGTDVSNFMVNRGGYNCGHQWRPCSEDIVPEEIKNKTFASAEYRVWARTNGKAIPDLPKKPEPAAAPPAPVPKKEKPAVPGNIDLGAVPEIKNVYDVSSILKGQKENISDWFNNTEFKKLVITHDSGKNGGTDMNGNIALSPEKARLLSEALNKIKQGVELSLENEMAMSTFWHEVWHNKNQSTNPPTMTTAQRRFMELGNEFVSRKTLPEVFEKFGGKLSNTELMNDRADTLYNPWVKNYDALIKHFAAAADKVIDYMKRKMQDGDYDKVKEYLIDAILNATGDGDKKKVANGVQKAISLSEKEFKDYLLSE